MDFTKTLSTQTVASNTLWITAGQFLNFGFKFITIPILARLLSPDDFGIVNICLVIAYFLNQFGEEGFANALIQSNRSDREVWNALFWLNTLLAVAVAAFLFIFADGLASLFNEHRAASVLAVLSVFFAIRIVGSIQLAFLQRAMKFAAIAKWRLIGNLIGSTGAVIAAFLGAGLWSLVIQQALTITIENLGFFYNVRYLPRGKAGFRKAQPTIRFGIRLALLAFLEYVTLTLPVIFVARHLPVSLVGIYSVAQQMATLPNHIFFSGAKRVLFPAYALIQDQPERLSTAFIRALRLLTLLQSSLFLGMWAVAAPLVAIILGEGWLEVIPIFGYLLLAMALSSPKAVIFPFFRAVGRTTAFILLSLLNLILVGLVCFFGIRWQLEGIGIGLCLVNLSILPALALPAARIAKISYLNFMAQMLIPLAVTALGASAAKLCLVWLQGYWENVWITLILGVTIWFFTTAAICWLVMREDVLGLLQISKKLRANMQPN